MDASYFNERFCVSLAQFARGIVDALGLPGDTPSSILQDIEALECGASTSSSFVSSTRTLVEGFVNDFLGRVMTACVTNPRTKKRRAKGPLDLSNMRIQEGYAADTFALCGGLG